MQRTPQSERCSYCGVPLIAKQWFEVLSVTFLTCPLALAEHTVRFRCVPLH